MHTAAAIVTVVLDARAPVSWTETAPMAELITQLDPFSPGCWTPRSINDETSGPERTLASIPELFRETHLRVSGANPADYTITDEVVMDYWESRDDELHWTPIFCPEVL